jgi:cobalt-zinc-cadmium efflux system outer membrane protein
MLPKAEEAYRLYLARYREMAAAYPQVLVAQRTFFEMSNEYLEQLDEAWRAAIELQGFLAGDGLDRPKR